ncbi:hypothetical protein [Cerasicoccus frondis]|uniref:hypothetical protein n=1 Tax=Cerasicoccus frondis TaxID=490090 RepID=UPI002852A016|nr:hypothetical protein [Cerasicoccus frondis]
MNWLIHIAALLERKPALGWLAAAVPTATGALNLMQHVQAALGIISMLIGIAVGLTTLILQIRKLRKVERAK